MSDQQVFNEAMRLVPALMACRFRDSTEDAMSLMTAFHDEQTALGRPQCELWSIMFSAAMSWFGQTVRVAARAKGEDPTEMLQEMSVAAASWEARRAG